MNKEEEHQPREHAVLCRLCLRRNTWNHDAICDYCHENVLPKLEKSCDENTDN